MENCLFCKIAKGEIPSYKVYEDQEFIGFLDINPRNPGHTLIIPKYHEDHLWDLPDEVHSDLMVRTKKVANGIRRALSPKRVLMLVLGFDVSHVHIHLIPRFDGDAHKGDFEGFVDFSHIADISESEMENLREKIAKELNS